MRWEGRGSWAGPGSGRLCELCVQGQRWVPKQDLADGVSVRTEVCESGEPREWGQPPVGLRVWLWDPGVSWGLSLPGTLGGHSRSVGGAPGARTLHFWILHEQEEGMAQRGTHGLGAAEEQIVCGHQQSIHDEVAQRVLLFLQGLRAGDVSQGGGRSLCAETLRPAPRRPARLLLGASSAPPLFNFLSLGDLRSAEGREGKISAMRPIK